MLIDRLKTTSLKDKIKHLILPYVNGAFHRETFHPPDINWVRLQTLRFSVYVLFEFNVSNIPGEVQIFFPYSSHQKILNLNADQCLLKIIKRCKEEAQIFN